MVTAELALAMPVLTGLLVLALSGLVTVLDQVRCVDAAGSTARGLARGDDPGKVLASGRGLAPSAATLTWTSTADMVEVRVSAPPAPALRWLGVTAAPAARVVALREDAGGAGP